MARTDHGLQTRPKLEEVAAGRLDLQCGRHALSKLGLLADSVPMRVPEKRRDDRLLCAGLIEVHWTGADGKALAAFANLDDVSPGGVSLLLECPLPQGALVEFSHTGQKVSGAVRYCNPTEFGWIAGMQFGPQSRWDPEVSPPEYLLDPQSIPENAQPRKGALLARRVRSPISCLALGEAMRREKG